MKFSIIGTVCAIAASIASASKTASPAVLSLAQIGKSEYERGFQAGLAQVARQRVQQDDDLNYYTEDGTLVTSDDEAWNYDDYQIWAYREYFYIDSNGRKISYGNPRFNWDDYYAWYYAQTFHYERWDGSTARYGDNDFDWEEFYRQQAEQQ
ncbi:hypothetical protein FGO68_gene818 [Halteria grandinella]|uniref:Uncharacterized protein n=1 Tax=Halteria grandinella TaxID=5974 RepID=A0A8J8SYI4_HALGN|nr:hypothetical protein FGO68_gene818 [Halteria grandinella]